MACEDSEGAIDLFGQHHAGEFVGHRECGKGNLVLGSSAKIVRKTIGIAAEKNQLTRPAIAEIAEPAGELLGGLLLASRVEEDDGRGRIEFQFPEKRGGGVAQFADLKLGVAANARG